MASVIRFGTIDIPKEAIAIFPAQTLEMNYTADYFDTEFVILTKNRSLFANTTGAPTSLSLYYDLGTTKDRTVDYFAVIHANRIQKGHSLNLDISLRSDADGLGSYTTRKQIDYSQSASRHSPRDEDILETFTSVTTNHRYWEVELKADTTLSAQVWQATQFYFGELFDIGADPIDFSARQDMKQGELISENGSTHYAPTNYKPIEFTISYMGISDAKVLAVQAMIETANRYGVILYSTNTNLTDGYSMCHCDNMRVEVKRIWTNYNSVTIKLTEIY